MATIVGLPEQPRDQLPVERRRTAREAHPAGRPRLRVVPPEYVPARARRRRGRLLVAFTATLVVLGLLAIASLHVVLTQGQFQLERVEAKAAEEQARFDRLRLEVAELESPARIVAAAQERLGMVPPPGITYLSPTGVSGGDMDEATAVPASVPSDWSEVKRHLAAQP